MPNANSKKVFSQNGFTLIEALVAITILLIGVLGPLTAATRGITDGVTAKNQIIALGLAQEGIELVQSKIISNSMSRNLWLNGLDGSPDCISGTCSVDVITNDYTSCAGLCKIIQNPATGIYVSDPTGTGFFSRTIQIVKTSASGPLPANTEAKITVTVSWMEKTQSRSVTLNTYVYNPN